MAKRFAEKDHRTNGKRYRYEEEAEDFLPASQDSVTSSQEQPTWRKLTVDEIVHDLGEDGQNKDICEIFREHKIDGNALGLLTEENIKEMGISEFGVQLNVWDAVCRLKQRYQYEDMINVHKIKIFNDSIHGHIDLHPLCVKIMDTPQFQRLRFIKQLGGAYFVFPGAAHNRFEHCLGVCYLAGKLARTLQRRQRELNITDIDVLCVEIAGLCHDLGHGPFSHMYDGVFIPYVCPDKNWKHEEASVKMLDYLIEDNHLQEAFSEYGLSETDITFIKEQINPPNSDSQVWQYKGRIKEKAFLYEIVANKRNGIDVDKWDYFARDCHHLGIKNNFDHMRYMKFARVLKDKEGGTQICSRDKEANNLYDMFYTRATLHRRAYQHPVNKSVESMITEALVKADKHIRIPGKNGKMLSLSESVDDMVAFCKLTDFVFHQILLSTDDHPDLNEAKEILKRIQTRKLYKCVAHIPVDHSQEDTVKFNRHGNKEKEIRKEIVNSIPDSKLDPDKLVISCAQLDYGMNSKNPMDNVLFYNKSSPDVAYKLAKHEVSQMLPHQFSEQILRLYCKDSDDEATMIAAKKCFEAWCSKHSLGTPQNSNSVSMLRVPSTPKQNGNGIYCHKHTPKTAGKFRTRLIF